MRLRRFLIRLIKSLGQWFVWLGILFRRLVDKLERLPETGDEIETTADNPPGLAEHGPPKEWLAHVRRDPPADWVNKVRQGAPQLLDPQLRPSQPPAPPAPRPRMGGKPAAHRPSTTAEGGRSQPLKQVRFQAANSTASQAKKAVKAASPLTETASSGSKSTSSESVEASDDGPPLSDREQLLAAAFPALINEDDETVVRNWPELEQSGRPPVTEPISDSLPFRELVVDEGRTSLVDWPSLLAADSKSPLPVSEADQRLEQGGQQGYFFEAVEPTRKSDLPPGFDFGRLSTYVTDWVDRLFSQQPPAKPVVNLPYLDEVTLPRPTFRLEEAGRQPEQGIGTIAQNGTVWAGDDRLLRPLETNFRQNASSTTPAKLDSPMQRDYWPPLAETADQDLFGAGSSSPYPAHIEFSTNERTGRPEISPDYWPSLPDKVVNETAEFNNKVDLDFEEIRRMRLDFEQRGPEWNE